MLAYFILTKYDVIEAHVIHPTITGSNRINYQIDPDGSLRVGNMIHRDWYALYQMPTGNESAVKPIAVHPDATRQLALGEFVAAFTALQRTIHSNMVDKGFWPNNPQDRNRGEAIALMHSELSECLEGIRHGNPPDDKVPEFTAEEAELADTIIRIMDYAGGFNLRVAEAIVAKTEMNTTREQKHGKAF